MGVVDGNLVIKSIVSQLFQEIVRVQLLKSLHYYTKTISEIESIVFINSLICF